MIDTQALVRVYFVLAKEIVGHCHSRSGSRASWPEHLKEGVVTNQKQDPETMARYAEAAMRWSGWGSPIGLGFLLGSIGFFLLCLHWAGIL